MFADPIDQREANEQIKFESRGDAHPFHIYNNHHSLNTYSRLNVPRLQNRYSYLSVTEYYTVFQNNPWGLGTEQEQDVVPTSLQALYSSLDIAPLQLDVALLQTSQLKPRLCFRKDITQLRNERHSFADWMPIRCRLKSTRSHSVADCRVSITLQQQRHHSVTIRYLSCSCRLQPFQGCRLYSPLYRKYFC